MTQVQQEILINAPIECVFNIITDYENYSDFLPDMKSVTVESRKDGIALVRFEIELIMRVSYTLRLVEEPPRRLSWTLHYAKMISLNNGSWELEPKDDKTLARYALEVKLRGLIPKSVSTRLLGTTLPDMLQRFRNHAENIR
ncbi:MAG: SRPBCC family protein [Deltaproteobacteria bacterium]|nr:SRPBCC family protein [Deltaproteobacteria bacterium]